MTAIHGREHTGRGWRALLIALLALTSIRPSAGAAVAGPHMVAYLGTGVLESQPAPAYGALLSPQQPRQGIGSVPVPPTVRACSVPSAIALPSVPVQSSSVQTIRGGQQVVVHATTLPPHVSLGLVIEVPRKRLSGNLSVPVTYSPPVVSAASDSMGRLVDLAGHQGVRVWLPDDTASGTGTISLLRQAGSALLPVQQVMRTWRFPVAPSLPSVSIEALDARGRPAAHAIVEYSGVDARGRRLACRGETDARGNLLLTGLAEGPATVVVRHDNTSLGDFHPIAVAGETTALHASLGGPITTPRTVLGHTPPFCNVQTGYVYRLLDSASGMATARSGDGPFGVFLAGVSTLDTFTAQVTRKASDGTLVPILHDTPITLYIVIGNDFVPVARGTYGADVSGAGGQDTPGYTPVTLQYDMMHFPVGTNYIELEVGTGDRSCQTVYQIKVATSPGDTLLGTVDTYFDPATGSYQITGVLPTKPRLRFSQPIDLSIPAREFPEAHLPEAVFQDWQNEGDVGLEVNETVRTDGSWSGTVGGHARLTLFNHVLFNEQLPTLSGGGPNLASGSMTHTMQLARKNVDVSLFNYLIVIPELAIVIVVNVRFSAVGNLEARIGVPGTLNAVEFTLNPTITAKIIGSATLPTPIGAFSGALDGSLVLAAPVTLRAPGAPQWHFGVQASINASFSSPFSDHPSTTALVRSPCLGDCSASHIVIMRQAPVDRVSVPGQTGRMLVAGWPEATGSGVVTGAARAPIVVVPLTTVMERPQASNPQPATALSPNGLPATLWVDTKSDGAMTLQAQIGNGRPQALATNQVTLASPQVAWIGPRRALAVWVASTADPGLLDQLRSAQVGERTALLQALLAHQQVFTATWDGHGWSTPSQLTQDGVLNGEPSLAADPATGRAALLWVRGATTALDAGGLANLGLAGALYDRGGWSPIQTLPNTDGGANAPSIALDADDHPAAAWLAGPLGMGRPVFARMISQGWSAPVPVQGLRDDAQRVSLAFDGAGRPVMVDEATHTLQAARREPTGLWRTWDLGSGSNPRLARGTADTMLLLADRQPTMPSDQPLNEAVMAELGATGWGPLAPISGDTPVAGGQALAADPATGAVRVVVTVNPMAKNMPMLLGGALPARHAYAIDPSAGIRAINVSPGSASTLVPEDITLNDPHPRPGEPITVQVRVRNLGTTPVAAGASIGLRAVVADRVRLYRLHLAHALPFNAAAVLTIDLMAPAAPLTISAFTAGGYDRSAVLALPLSPREVYVTQSPEAGHSVIVQWTAVADRDITGYRIYRLGNHGAPVLAGVAYGSSWTDPMSTGPGTAYAVTAVDAQGRESFPASTNMPGRPLSP